MDEVEMLTRMLSASDKSEAIRAMETLGELGDRRAVRALTEVILTRNDDYEGDLRMAAVDALEHIGPAGLGGLLVMQCSDFARYDLEYTYNVAIEVGYMLKAISEPEEAKDCKWGFDQCLALLEEKEMPAVLERAAAKMSSYREELKKIESRKPEIYRLLEVLCKWSGQWAEDAAESVETMIDSCKTLEELSQFEIEMNNALEELKDAGIEANSHPGVARVMNFLANTKNELSDHRDLLLEGMPKPPKQVKRKTWQAVRRVQNG